MKLLFVRHGKAENPDLGRWNPDSERPLTAKGRRRFVQSVPRIRSIAPDVLTIFTSPYTRALHTAQILAEEAEWHAPIIDHRLAGSSGIEEMLQLAQSLDISQSYALVGHDPVISLAPSVLIGKGYSYDTALKPGGIALVDTGDNVPEPGKATLVTLAQPKQLVE